MEEVISAIRKILRRILRGLSITGEYDLVAGFAKLYRND